MTRTQYERLMEVDVVDKMRNFFFYLFLFWVEEVLFVCQGLEQWDLQTVHDY